MKNSKPVFYPGHIVTWNGVICDYGAIMHMITPDCHLEMATQEEKELYKKGDNK